MGKRYPFANIVSRLPNQVARTRRGVSRLPRCGAHMHLMASVFHVCPDRFHSNAHNHMDSAIARMSLSARHLAMRSGDSPLTVVPGSTWRFAENELDLSSVRFGIRLRWTNYRARRDRFSNNDAAETFLSAGFAGRVGSRRSLPGLVARPPWANVVPSNSVAVRLSRNMEVARVECLRFPIMHQLLSPITCSHSRNKLERNKLERQRGQTLNQQIIRALVWQLNCAIRGWFDLFTAIAGGRKDYRWKLATGH